MLREKVGIAVARGKSSVVTYALGAAQDESRDERRLEFAGVTRLSADLWRARYGADRGALVRCGIMIVVQIRIRAKRQRWHYRHNLFEAFVGRVLSEWMENTCQACYGRGYAAFDDAGLPMRVVSRGEPLRVCSACHGTRLRPVSSDQRARALGISADAYQRHWPDRFAELLGDLDRWEDAIVRPLLREISTSSIVE